MLCSRVHHYSIEKQTDGTYMIPAGRKFIGPVELIMHHQTAQDGVITLLRSSCDRLDHQFPVAFRGMTYQDLELELLKKADSIKVLTHCSRCYISQATCLEGKQQGFLLYFYFTLDNRGLSKMLSPSDISLKPNLIITLIMFITCSHKVVINFLLKTRA